MNLLILGGTRFLGRALVEEALAQGDEVTLFNRGLSGPALFPHLEHIRGDRNGGLEGLHGRTWDAVIDTCGYVPRLVGDAARLLADAVDLYTFISSISVYADPVQAGSDEDAPLVTMPDPVVEAVTGETYGPLKVLCEQEATAVMGGRALLVRAGLIVGPHDPTDRFTYWPARAAGGGEILAPAPAGAPVQLIDVRDLAAWIIRATRARHTGPFNVTGPAQPLTMAQMLQACQEGSATASLLTWVNGDFLQQQGVAPWVDLPLWLAEEDRGIMQIAVGKGLAAGLQTRPLQDTVRDTLAWARQRPEDYEWQAGLAPAREAELLARWHAAREHGG